MNKIMPFHDTLIGIAHYLPVKRRNFHYNLQKFNGFFYRKKEQHAELFGNLLFDINGNFPISEEISETIQQFVLSGLILPASVSSLNYQFSTGVDRYFNENIKNQISQQQSKSLENLAVEFEVEISKA